MPKTIRASYFLSLRHYRPVIARLQQEAPFIKLATGRAEFGAIAALLSATEKNKF